MPNDAAPSHANLLPINAVAERFGIKASALRYYEEIGLLQPIVRRAGRRYYGLAELRRLSLVQLLQDVGSMSLKEIMTIIQAGSDDRAARDALEARVALLEEQIEAAKTAMRYLNHRLTCSRENPFDDCPVLGRELSDRLRDVGIVSVGPSGAEQPMLAEAKAALEAGIHRTRKSSGGAR